MSFEKAIPGRVSEVLRLSGKVFFPKVGEGGGLPEPVESVLVTLLLRWGDRKPFTMVEGVGMVVLLPTVDREEEVIAGFNVNIADVLSEGMVGCVEFVG